LGGTDGLVESEKTERLAQLHQRCNKNIVICILVVDEQTGELFDEILYQNLLVFERSGLFLIVLEHQIAVVFNLSSDLRSERLIVGIGLQVKLYGYIFPHLHDVFLALVTSQQLDRLTGYVHASPQINIPVLLRHQRELMQGRNVVAQLGSIFGIEQWAIELNNFSERRGREAYGFEAFGQPIGEIELAA
jgi:hypothetical protein